MRLRSRYKKNEQVNQKQHMEKKKYTKALSGNLQDNIDMIKSMLGEPEDLVVRTLSVAGKDCAIAYIDGLVDSEFLHNFIMKDLQKVTDDQQGMPEESLVLFQKIEEDILSASAIKHGKTMSDVFEALLDGETVIYVDGVTEVLIVNTVGGEHRSVEEPQAEGVLRGPREGFVENIQTNTVLIRRRIKDPNLRMKTHSSGRRSKKSLVVFYIEGIVHPNIIEEVNRRLASIDVDDAIGVTAIEQWIEDSFLSPFPQVSSTERPDGVETALLNGRVAIMLDGTPFVLIVPSTLSQVLKSPEDYYYRWSIASFTRILRYFAAFLAVFLPSLYVALTSFHVGLIPSDLAFFIAASREGVPFSATIEALLMVATMELLREAGARLPKAIGQTIGIVGGLVIGEAAVTAGIVSPIMVIVVALNAIASFAIPDYTTAATFRVLLFLFIIAAATLGLYGIVLAYIIVNIHIVNLKSFGIPYSAPFSPGFIKDFRDVVVQLPISLRKRNRPVYLQPGDKTSSKQGGKQK